MQAEYSSYYLPYPTLWPAESAYPNMPADTSRQPLAQITTNRNIATAPQGEKHNVGQSPPDVKPVTGEKRSSTWLSNDDPEQDGDDTDSDHDLDGMVIDKNADQVRRMITAFLDSGSMKVTEFQNKLNLSSRSYYAFMRQNGPQKGVHSETFQQAWAFFKRRELKGIPAPRKKAKKAANTSAGSASASKHIPGSESADKDLSEIHLEGEDTDSVPIYETCDSLRKKINAHLRKKDVVQAAFLRDVKAQFHTARAPAKLQGNQLARFRSQSGADSGNTSPIFYGAYCFFEKLRIAEGKEKTDFRLEMEKIYRPTGYDTKTRAGRGVFCHVSQRPIEDEYGRITFQRVR